jgi:outer membrane protein assembly factor BamA
VRSLLLALLLALLPPAARAQSRELAGLPITGIEIEGLRTLSDETLRYYLGLEVGQPFEPQQLDRNLHALWERDLIDDVTVEALPAPGGVALVLRVVERPVLRSV